MRRKQRPVLLRAPGLAILLVLLVATAGLVYAHWTTQLRVDGQINTGGLYVEWQGAWTNDDGVPDPNDNENVASPAYDFWGDQSSADPSDETGDNRYDKDVGACWAEAQGDTLKFNVENAYPSYHCALTALLANQGSIPVRATSLMFSATRSWDDESGHHDTSIPINPGPYEGNFVFGNTPQVEGDVSLGVRCGTQIDPSNCRYWFTYDGDQGEHAALWWGPVSQDESGFFADVDENSWSCGYDEGSETYNCAPEGDGYQSDGQFNDDDFYVERQCDLEPLQTSGWIHVMEDAYQNASYQFEMTQEFVNWNEWDVSMCTPGSWVDPDGIPDNDDEYQYLP